MTTIIYSAQRSGFAPGKVYENPRYFREINRACTMAVVLGNWPNVVEAYQAAGVPVATSLEGDPVLSATSGTQRASLPDNLEELPIQDLRALVDKASPGRKITSKNEGIAFLKAHYAISEPETPVDPTSTTPQNDPVGGDDKGDGDNLL